MEHDLVDAARNCLAIGITSYQIAIKEGYQIVLKFTAADFALSTSSAIEYFHLAAQVVGYLEGITVNRSGDDGYKPTSTIRGAAG